MCGIWGFICSCGCDKDPNMYTLFNNVKPRGPDRSSLIEFNEKYYDVFMGFHRLAIMDKSTNGDQPFIVEEKNRRIIAMCNGEIYNYKHLLDKYDLTHKMKSSSDCEFLPHVYAIVGFDEMLKQMRGEFAVCIVDINMDTGIINVFIGRDQTAVRPVFIGYDETKRKFSFSSILSGIIEKNKCMVRPITIRQVNGGEIVQLVCSKNEFNVLTRYYHTIESNDILKEQYAKLSLDETLNMIRNKFIEAVEIRLCSDRPLGALLSGGLDSSLVVSIAARYLAKLGMRMRTFSIGIPGSTDKEYAEMVAKFCDTDHTHVEFSETDFINAIDEVIKATETYDITSVRASVGQYLISKWIRENTDIKVLLIGDGSDELCSGYMYFHNAPNAELSHNENIKLVKNIHFFDALRADRCIAYNGIEARVPFLDHEFVDMWLSLPHELRIPTREKENNRPQVTPFRGRPQVTPFRARRIEKWLLRKSFDHMLPFSLVGMGNSQYLPDAVLWRKKEAFSDGVSSTKRSWYQIASDHFAQNETITKFLNSDKRFAIYDHTLNTDRNNNDIHFVMYEHIIPKTPEAIYYKYRFSELFSHNVYHVIPYYWLPNWSDDATDPSARTLAVYDE